MLFYMAVTVLFAVTIVALVATIEWLFGRFLPPLDGKEAERVDRW